MKKIENIRTFTEEEVAANGGRPDYIFSDDESTALLWPELAEADDGSLMNTIRVIEHHAGEQETVELRILGYEMPEDADEYNEILRNADGTEIEGV